MGFKIAAILLLSLAFLTGFFVTLAKPKPSVTTPTPVTRELTISGESAVPAGTTTATILGSIVVDGTIPAGSTINVQAKTSDTKQFSTVLQNLPAKPDQPFSYTKATNGTSYSLQATLLDTMSKVIGQSEILTVFAPSLNVQFTINSVAPSPTPTLLPTSVATPTPAAVSPTATLSLTPTPTPTPTPAPVTLSGNISFHGNAPINSRVVILWKLANASTYQVAVDNVTPVDGTIWQWSGPTTGNSYTVIAVLKQRQGDGSDTDIATSAPVTVTAPAAFIVLTVNSAYTLTKPSGAVSVNCTSYNSGPNQNTWTVLVGFPGVAGAKSYWLQIGSTDGGNDIVNSAGSVNYVYATVKNNTTYYGRYAYATVSGVATGSDQFSVFSDTTQVKCSR